MPVYPGPKVNSVIPMSGSEGISALVNIKVSFTEMMSADTLSENYIYLRPFGSTTQKISCTVAFDAGDNKTIVLNPVSQLADNTQYEVVVVGQNTGTPILSLLDEPLYETYISSFTTAEATPVPPPPDDGGDPTPVLKPYVVSAYPRKDQYNISPTSIKLKFSESVSSLTFTLGNGTTSGVFNLIEGELLPEDLNDIDILPVVYVDGTHIVNGNIFEFTPADLAIKKDQTYTIVLTGDITESYVASFQSAYTDFYGDMNLIKGDISKYIKISDSLLARNIAVYSAEAREIADQYYTGDTYDEIDWTDPPLFIWQYVRFKTLYELVNNKYIELTTSSSMVQLGDFTVQNTVSAQGLASFRNGLGLQLKRWDDELHGQHNRGYARPVAVDKRTTNEYGDGYPEYINRGLKDLDGNKTYDSTTS